MAETAKLNMTIEELNTLLTGRTPDGRVDTIPEVFDALGNGTVSRVRINSTDKAPDAAGVVDLGTVITQHQDISGKQDRLVSGDNIMTINGKSILGSGDITTANVYNLTIATPDPYHGAVRYIYASNWDKGSSKHRLVLCVGQEWDAAQKSVYVLGAGATTTIPTTSFILPIEGRIAANTYIDVVVDGIIVKAAVIDGSNVKKSDIGVPNGVAGLDSSGKVPSDQLPSYVDEVVEAYARSGQTPLSQNWLSTDSAGQNVIVPSSGKIYVLMADSGEYSANSQFRWGGTTYVRMDDGGASPITDAEIDNIIV